MSGTASNSGILLLLTPRLTRSGSLLVLVTFLVQFYCRQRHCRELPITFKVPSGCPSDEQPRSLPDLSRVQPPPSSLPKRLVSWRLHQDTLTRRTCWQPQLPWGADRPRHTALSSRDSSQRKLDIGRAKMDSFPADKRGVFAQCHGRSVH